jgi:hypothetical protein
MLSRHLALLPISSGEAAATDATVLKPELKSALARNP